MTPVVAFLSLVAVLLLMTAISEARYYQAMKQYRQRRNKGKDLSLVERLKRDRR